ALAQRGANLRATTAVVDINSMGRGAFAGVLFGNPQAPPAAGQQGGQAGRGGQAGGPGQAPPAQFGGQGGQGGGQGGGEFGGRGGFQGTAGVDRQYQLNELVYAQGGLAAIHLAARQGYTATVDALLASGADINQLTAGDRTTPMLVATINGHFDLAKSLL